MKVGLNLEKIILFYKTRRYTMISPQRLNNVFDLVQIIEKNRMEGVLIECGVWKGGCVAVMAYVLKKQKSSRKLWLFDSFEGLPESTVEDGKKAKNYSNKQITGKLKSIDRCVASENDVKEIFRNLKLSWKNVVLRKGWFQNTLPKAKNEIDQISLLRLDGDWYESTKVCLENLYDKVVKGGFIVIDDYYHWEGCKKAIDEYFGKRKIKITLNKVDQSGVFFQKK